MADLSGIDVEQLAWLYAQKLEEASHAAYQARKAEEDAGKIRVELAKRLTIGEVIAIDETCDLVCLPPRAGARSVDHEGVLRHAESLEPLGLAPHEVPRLEWPKVADIDRQAELLQRAGIAPGELLTRPPPGAPRIEVRRKG